MSRHGRVVRQSEGNVIFSPQLKLCKSERLSSLFNGKFIFPINLEISLTGRCNAACQECFYKDSKDNTDINYELLLDFLISAKYNLKAITWTGGGEPTLHYDFHNITQQVDKDCKIEQGLFTNALNTPYYLPWLFKWIRVSKTNFDWPEENIKLLRQKNENVGLCVNYNGNDNDIETGLKIVHDNDLRYINVRPALNTSGQVVDIKPPAIKDKKLIISKYKFDQASKKRDYDKCYGYKFVPFLWHNGDLDACAYHKNNPCYNFGNIYSHSYDHIIENINKKEFVHATELCQICCKNHEINRLINDMYNLEDENFV